MTAQTKQSTETEAETTKVFTNENPISLAARISGKTVTIEYGGTYYDIYDNQELDPSRNVTLTITASDGTTALHGTYVPEGGNSTPFSTNDAPTISQVFQAPTGSAQKKEWSFSVTLDTGAVADPTLILRTKSRDDERPE
ncbi:MAG: hypothetical protein AB1Z98_34935 [Nannocystaceae bacterium]